MSTWFEVAVAAVCWVPVSLTLACVIGRGLRRSDAFGQSAMSGNVLEFPQAALLPSQSTGPMSIDGPARSNSLSV